jgi:hypothetical protein
MTSSGQMREKALRLSLNGYRCKDVADVFELIRISMEFVEGFNNMDGFDKEKMVVLCVTHIIINKVDDKNLKEILLTLVEPSIKCFINVSKNKWLINTLKKKSKFNCFCLL